MGRTRWIVILVMFEASQMIVHLLDLIQTARTIRFLSFNQCQANLNGAHLRRECFCVYTILGSSIRNYAFNVVGG